MTLSFPSHFLIPLETHSHFPKAHTFASGLVYLHAKHIPMSWLTRPLLPIDRRAVPRKPEPPPPEKPYPTKEKKTLASLQHSKVTHGRNTPDSCQRNGQADL